MSNVYLPERLYIDPTDPGKGYYSHLGLTTITSDDPAANTEISYTVPAGRVLVPIMLTWSCVQGATQTPLPTLRFATPGGTVFFSSAGASAAQNASVTTQYTYFVGQTQGGGGAATTGGNSLLSQHVLPPGSVIDTSTSGKGANTNHGAMTIFGLLWTL